jgi:hypothetical protein
MEFAVEEVALYLFDSAALPAWDYQRITKQPDSMILGYMCSWQACVSLAVTAVSFQFLHSHYTFSVQPFTTNKMFLWDSGVLHV